MDPPKVEVSMSGCIMVPSPNPQPRVVPISAYEASLVSRNFIYLRISQSTQISLGHIEFLD